MDLEFDTRHGWVIEYQMLCTRAWNVQEIDYGYN